MSRCSTLITGLLTLVVGSVGLAGTPPVEHFVEPSDLVFSGGARQEAACCTLGGVCRGGNPNEEADQCPGTHTCEGTSDACESDSDCAPGNCSVTVAKECHMDWDDPNDPYYDNRGCPVGEQCEDFVRCTADDCDGYACSDDPPVACTPDYAGDNTDCTAGACDLTSIPCHDDFDCPPGWCSDVPSVPCHLASDCLSPFATCNDVDFCVGGATCDPLPCTDAALCELTEQAECEDVLDGFWKEGAAVCVPDPIGHPDENVCQEGSCCYGDPDLGSVCDDDLYDTVETCATANQSQFVPGAACVDDPCMACPFESEDHCQFFDQAAGLMSTCDRYIGRDFMCVDDFVALTSGPLERVCWWPGFAPTAGNPECSDPGLTPPGYWRLRVFEDLGHIPDEGAELGPIGGQDLVVDLESVAYGRIWQYSAPVGEGVDPINLTQDECYWLEISGQGEDDCVIYWAQSNKGNQHAMQDFNQPDYPHYTTEDAINTDFAFCVDVGIVTDGPTVAGCGTVIGGCCLCPATGETGVCVECTNDVCGLLTDPFENPGSWKLYRYCSDDTPCETNALPPYPKYCTGEGEPTPCEDDLPDCLGNGTCEEKPLLNCVGHGDEVCRLADYQCDPNPCSGIPANDLCTAAVSVFHPDCVGGFCSDGPDVGEECDAADDCMVEQYYDNRCAETEPGAPTNCVTPPPNPGDLSFDLWYRYVVPACGTVVVETCESLPIFDGFGAIYRIEDLTDTPGVDGTWPQCCGTADGLIFDGTEHDYGCSDDDCGAGGPWHYEVAIGEGTLDDPPYYEELLLRVGAWWDGDPAKIERARDTGTFTIDFRDEDDESYAGEYTDHCPIDAYPPLPAPYPDNRRRNRYISFDPNPDNAGLNVAFKVTLTSLQLGSCDGSGNPNVEGWPCRGDDDCRACSGSGDACWTRELHCSPAETCDVTGAACLNDHTVDPGNVHHSVGRNWWVGPEDPSFSNVHLMVTQPYRKVSAVWPPVVHVGDCEIVPVATYEVVAVNVDTADESDALEVSTIDAPGTTNYWADCVGKLGDYCQGNWRPCDTDADCPFCYNPLLGDGGSSLTSCVDDDDCDPVTTGEFCGTVCVDQWPPPDGFINFDDVTAAVFCFTPLPGLTVTDVKNVDLHGNNCDDANVDPPNIICNFNDIAWMIKAFKGYPYPFNDPGDCPLEMGACCSSNQTCAMAACSHCLAYFAGAGTTCADNNGNGVADACEPYPPLPSSYPDNVRKNRYITFDPNKAENDGVDIAFKVELKSLLLGSCSETGAPCGLEENKCNPSAMPCEVDADCPPGETCFSPDCGTCAQSGAPCSNDFMCIMPPADVCMIPNGDICVNDQAGSVGMSWWVGPKHPTNPVYLMVTEPYRVVSGNWPAVVRVGDCEIVPVATYGVRAVNVDAGAESAELEVATIDKPGNAYWADISGPQGPYCRGNWRPCGGDANCGFCYDWTLGPGNANNGSSLTPCTVDDDCLVDNAFVGEYCGTVCDPSLWSPPDGILGMSDSLAMSYMSQADRTDLDLDYVVTLVDGILRQAAMDGAPYPGGLPGNCPDVPGWP